MTKKELLQENEELRELLSGVRDAVDEALREEDEDESEPE